LEGTTLCATRGDVGLGQKLAGAGLGLRRGQ